MDTYRRFEVGEEEEKGGEEKGGEGRGKEGRKGRSGRKWRADEGKMVVEGRRRKKMERRGGEEDGEETRGRWW